MKKLAFGALFVGLLVACGGGNDSKKVVVIDGSLIDAPGQCNPLTQAGCMTGEKCTWLLDALMPQYVGHVGCAPDGTKMAGEACMYGAPGATGYDDCKKGTVCGNYRGGAGTCKTICDQQGGQPMCDSTHVCVTYSGLFSTGDTTPAAGGVCDLACDPLLDNDFDGSGSSSITSAAKAKRAQTCGSNAAIGCYGYPSFGSPPATGWSCTGDINYMEPAPGLRHRVQCTEANNCADPGPTVYINSCNQGYLPLLRESSMVSTAVCIALCKPKTCYSGQCGGTTNVDRIGDTNDGCRGIDRVTGQTQGFNNQNDGDGGEHCTHMWYFEIDDQNQFLQSTTSDTLGFCYNHSVYVYDSNGNGMADTTDNKLPNCGMLGSGAGSGSDATMPLSYFGALDLGCVPSTFLMANGKPQLPESLLKKRQQMDLPRALYRRTMGSK